MAVVPLLEPDQMAEDDARVVVRSGSLNVFRALAHSPALLRPWMRLAHRLLTQTTVGPRQRELIILRVGHLAGCAYEVAQHETLGAAAGITPAELAAVAAGDLEAFAALERDLLHLAGALAFGDDPTSETVEAVRQALGDRGLVEVLMLASHYLGLARVLNVLQVEVDPTARLNLA